MNLVLLIYIEIMAFNDFRIASQARNDDSIRRHCEERSNPEQQQKLYQIYNAMNLVSYSKNKK